MIDDDYSNDEMMMIEVYDDIPKDVNTQKGQIDGDKQNIIKMLGVVYVCNMMYDTLLEVIEWKVYSSGVYTESVTQR